MKKIIIFIILSLTMSLDASQNLLLECKEGKSEACIELSRYLEFRKEHSNALKLYKWACFLGNAQGCLNAGHKYFSGMGTKKNSSMSIKYYTAAFKQGLTSGYINIGNMYRHGQCGLSKDKHMANRYYSKACEAGDKIACRLVKKSFYVRTEKDDYKSIKALDRLCDDGRIIRSMYCNSIAGIYEKYEEYENAAKYYKKGCSGRLYMGCLQLGEIYIDGRGVERDFEKGIYYIEYGCNKGDHKACFKAGSLYEENNDMFRAKEFFQKGCELQFMEACTKAELLD